MTYPCPHCHAAADPVTGCPGCGRGPDPDAAEVVRLDAQIADLTARLAAARDAQRTLDAQLRETWARRQDAAARVRAAMTPAPRPPRVGTSPPLVGTPPPRAKEASTKLVQNALFLVGGLLLAVAAVVFTAVAWSQFGVGGRAALLAGFTGVALAVPLAALRRGLTATAETFAALGLLLVLLDGYAAWYVNLFGLADLSPLGYAGGVCAVTAAVAAGYEHLTGLRGPRYAALLTAQPVLPLVVAPLHPDAVGWAFLLAAVALLNLTVVHFRPSRVDPVAITAYAMGAVAVVAGGLSALGAVASAGGPGRAAAGGAALIGTALVVVAAAVSARAEVFRAAAAVVLMVAVALAAARFAAFFGGDSRFVVVVAALTALAVSPVPFLRLLSPTVRIGAQVGAALVLAVPAVAALAAVTLAAVRTIGAAQPLLSAGVGPALSRTGWQPVAIVALLTGAAIVLLPRARRVDVLATGLALTAFALPTAFGLHRWSAPALDLAVAAGCLAVAVRLRTGADTAPTSGRSMMSAVRGGSTGVVSLGWLCALAGPLAGHAVLVGLGHPGTAAATFAAVTVLGAGLAVLARSGARRADVGGIALTVGLLAVPPAAWTGALAFGSGPAGAARWTLAAAAALVAVLHLVAWRAPGYRRFAAVAALAAPVSAPLWALAAGDSPAVYAGAGLLLVATAALALDPRPATAARATAATAALSSTSATAAVSAVPAVVATSAMPAVPAAGARPSERRPVAAVLERLGTAVVPAGLLALALLAAIAPALAAVLARPFGWLGAIWSGRPAGTGLVPDGIARVATGDVVGLALLAAAIAALSYPHGWRAVLRTTAPVLSVAIPMALAAAGLAWPSVPVSALVIGLALLVIPALRGPAVPTATALTGAVLTAAGLAGSLPTEWSTLTALGLLLVAATTTGAAARRPAARVVGWSVAAAAALAATLAAAAAAALAPEPTALWLLAVSAVLLAGGALLTSRRDRPTVDRAVEGRALDAAAQAGAVVALLFAAGSIRHAAAVCALWGLALGLRALLPGPRRSVLVVVAASLEVVGWWLLMTAQQVTTIEVYTLPAAAVALLAGSLVLRSRRDLTSWQSSGPALGAAFLPSLAAVLTGDGQPVRRLLLGVAALAVVLAGAYARRQAPVVLGGVVLGVVALHEAALVWDLLPRWIPLAAAGLLLVVLAATLERRRRDLARFRAALGRMG